MKASAEQVVANYLSLDSQGQTSHKGQLDYS